MTLLIQGHLFSINLKSLIKLLVSFEKIIV